MMMLNAERREGREEKEKEDAINFYKNGASIDLICKSLDISEEKLNEYLNSPNEDDK